VKKKSNPQNAVLKALSRKKAVSIEVLKKTAFSAISDDFKGKSKPSYAITRAIKNVLDSGFAELITNEPTSYVRITNEGREKLYRDELSNASFPITGSWDGKWRMIILDVPENRKNEREALRYLLKKAGFVCLKNSVWISPFPFEHFFSNIKKDLGLTNELLIVVTQSLDEDSEKFFIESFNL
jgi:DNA-binding transcriptional regulator PaaX